MVDFESFHVPEAWSCNPFKEQGRLLVNTKEPVRIIVDYESGAKLKPSSSIQTKNVWKPYDSGCPPSELLKGVPTNAAGRKARSPADHSSFKPPAIPSRDELNSTYHFLFDRTILLHGDSMERLHLSDFCNFMGGNLTNIPPHHPASPPVYRKPMPTIIGSDGNETAASVEAKTARRVMEDRWENRKGSYVQNRPWVCDLKEYNSTVISVFTWGLQDMEDAFRGEDFFHGPSTWIDRFTNITLPLLSNLAVYFERPGILKPDLIELASGFWDLRGFTEQDFISRGIARPYPTNSQIPFGEIGQEREDKWAEEAREAVKIVAKSFAGPDGVVRDGPVISWRTMHHPKKNNYTPFTRAFHLDQLARRTLHGLRVES
ncbi:hypothetical protein P7C70_g9476, partial [Phenoliferia sp. Uapishka_3]